MRLGRNIGFADRAIRFAVGAASIALATGSLDGLLSVMAWTVGIDGLMTGVTGFSVLYNTFDFDTRPAAVRNEPKAFAS